MDKNILLQKLKSLSERGIAGEKENATILLKKLMKKYGITEEELKETEVTTVYIKIKNKIEERLASQLLYAFFNDAPLYKPYRNKSNYYTELTPAQAIEFKYMFSIYLEDFYRQELIFFRAFISKNKIFPKDSEAKDINELPLKEKKEHLLSQMMLQGIERTQIRKALNDK